MKKYFHLDRTSDTKIIGNYYPQCKALTKGYNNEAENSFYNFAFHKGRKVNFIPNLDGIIIHKTSRLTDVISCSVGPGSDLIISERFYNLLKSFKTSSIQYFDCYIYKGESRSKYIWVHFIYDLEKYVDYRDSLFTHPDESLLAEIKEIASYKDFMDFYEQKDKFGFIKAKKISLNAAGPDFFVIGRFNQKAYISERLRGVILNEKITGIEINEVDDIEFAS